MSVGGYYLYTSGGSTSEARRKAEIDARRARESSLDAAEKVGDKIDRAYDDAKATLESKYKKGRSEVERELEREKKEIGKQVEVNPPSSSKDAPPPPPTTPMTLNFLLPRTRWGEYLFMGFYCTQFPRERLK
jgi:hypothetical protein